MEETSGTTVEEIQQQQQQQQGAQQQPDANPQTTSADQALDWQKEIDRRVSAALAKQRKAFEREKTLSGLDEPQRAIAERDQTIAELKEQLATAQRERDRYELTKTLAAHQLPVELADIIPTDGGAEAILKRVQTVEASFRKAVEDGVNARISGKAPGRASDKGAKMTREDFRKLSVAELQKMAKENPDLYMELSGRK